jgi:Transposase
MALGGAAGGRLARRLALPVSRDTLLRLVRRSASVPPSSAPIFIGIYDFAWKRGQRYGTVICDLEHRRIIDLLPDWHPATIEAWLAHHPSIRIVACDRGAGYGHAVTHACPEANQVADRWHLMENATAAFLQAVRQSMRLIRRALATSTVDPDLLTSAQRLQFEGFLRREADNAVIQRAARAGMSIKEIVRRTGHSRKVVRGSFAVAKPTYSGFGRIRWSPFWRGLTLSGPQAAVTEPSCFGGCARSDMLVASESLPSGRRGVVALKLPRPRRRLLHHPLGRLRAS